MERSLERLWDIHEIRQLAYRYALAVDSHDYEAIVSLFCETDEPGPAPVVDIHFFRRVKPAFEQKTASSLLVGNHLISFDGPDSAKGHVYCLAMVEADQFFDQAIVYQDSYARQDGNWLFVQRKHLLWWGQERAINPMKQPPADWPASQVGAGIAADVIRRG